MGCCKDFAEILKETKTPLNVVESRVIQLRKNFGEIIPEFKGMADSKGGQALDSGDFV